MSIYKYFYTPFLITEVSDIWIHISFFLTGVINELTMWIYEVLFYCKTSDAV